MLKGTILIVRGLLMGAAFVIFVPILGWLGLLALVCPPFRRFVGRVVIQGKGSNLE